MPSKVFGPTDSVADTLTQVGTTYNLPPVQGGTWYIYQALVGKGNVVNAKTNAGHIVIETTNRNYFFAYGGGIGGATNSHTIPAEKIEMAIPAPQNTAVKVYVLDADVAKDLTVSLLFTKNPSLCIIGKLQANPTTFRTLAGGGVSANADTQADTAEPFTVSSKLTRASLQPEINGVIHQIRYAGSGVVDAKANSGILDIYVPALAGPYEYAVGNGAQGATLGGASHADVIDETEGIPVTVSSTIDIRIKTAEVVKNPVVSLSYW